MPKVKKHENPRDVIPRNIRILLAAHGYKQSYLAQRLGVSEATLSNWLSGRYTMQLDDLDHIAEILHTTPAKLYTPPPEFAENCTRLIC